MKHWLIGSVAAAVIITACGGGEKAAVTDTVRESVQAGSEKLTELKLRKGNASKAGDALTALSLSESGSGRVSFSEATKNEADATFKNVSIAIEDAEIPVTAGSLTFKGLDMTPAGASFSQMTLSDIAITPETEEDGVVKISSVQLTNPSPELGAWVASLLGQGEPAPFPGLEQLSFDGLSLNGLALSAEDIDELEVFELGAIDVRQLSENGVGSLVLEGLNLKGSDDGQTLAFSIGSMGMSGLNATMMKVFSSSFAEGANGGDTEEALASIMGLVSSNPGDPGYDSFTIEAFAADFAGLGIDMPNLEGVVTRDKKGRATRSVTKPFTLSVKADPVGEMGSQIAGPLGLMGYDVLNFSGQGDTLMDPDTDTYISESAKNFLALEDGFKFSYGGSLAGLADFYKAMAESAENGLEDQDALLGAVSALKLNSMEFNFEDNSIVEKGFSVAAAMSGQDLEAIRSQAIASAAFLPLMAGQAGVDPAMAGELGTALSKFLNDSGTISIKLAPETPLSAVDFEDPAKLTKARLGFSATTN